MGAKCRDSEKPVCPRCGGTDLWKNGTSRAGKQQYRCKGCERVFVVAPYLDGIVVEIADRMLRAELPVPVVAKILSGHVSRRWLYNRKGEICL